MYLRTHECIQKMKEGKEQEVFDFLWNLFLIKKEKLRDSPHELRMFARQTDQRWRRLQDHTTGIKDPDKIERLLKEKFDYAISWV